MPSYLPFLLILVVAFGTLSVAHVSASSVRSARSTYGTIPQPSFQNRNASTIGLGSAPIPELSWTAGQPFPTFDGLTIFPSLAPNLPGTLSTQTYATHWYAGSAYPSGLPTQNGVTIYTIINVPSSAPLSDEFYYVLLSAWDSAGSYNQIGFSDTWGTWGLTYSWTSGPPSSPTYHYSPNAMALSFGVPYTFYITTQSGVTHFAAYQGSNLVWSLDAPTGGNYLVLSYSYSGYYDYTNYEEVWYTSTSGGAPAFSFYFYNNYWISTGGGSNAATWSSWTSSGTPSNVAVVISGNSVLVTNPTYTVTFAESGIPSATSWGVTVGGNRYTSSTPSLVLTGLSGSVGYSYDSSVPGSGGNYICTSGCSGTVDASGSDSRTASYTFQPSTYSVTFQESGIPSGVIWSVTVGETRYASASSSVTVPSLSGTVNYFYDSMIILIGSGVRYVCYSGCSGQVSGSTTITAYYKTQYYLTVNSAQDSPNPASDWFDAGTPITASVTSPVSGGTGTQYACTGWTGSGSVPATGSSCSTSFTINTPSSITWNWKTQYQLGMQVNPSDGGTTSPAVGTYWYDSGQTVSIQAFPASGHAFSSWSGSGSGSYTGSNNPTSVTMNGPITETANFGIPKITVSPASAPPGYGNSDGTVIVSGQDFTPGSARTCQLTSTLGGLFATSPAPTCSISSSGAVTGSFVVASTATSSSYVVRVTDTNSAGVFAETGFTVLAAPTLAASPANGPSGTAVALSNSVAFAVQDAGACGITSSPAGLISSPACSIDSSGNLASTSFVVSANAPGGVYTIAVTGLHGDSASTSFTVTPQVALSPTSGSPPVAGSAGTQVTVSGTGFKPSGACTIAAQAGLMIDTTGEPACTLNANGLLSAKFRVGAGSTYNVGYVITVTGPGDDSATATFSVNPSIVLTPDSGSSGVSVSVKGSGFTANGGSCSLTGTPVSGGSTCNQAGDGTVAGQFRVATVPTGPYSITVNDVAGAPSASAPFTVTIGPIVVFNPNSGPTGTTVVVTGMGWNLVDTSVTFAHAGLFDGTKTCTVSGGSIASGCSFTVKSTALGSIWTLTFTGTQRDNSQAQFTVQSAFVVNPNNGGPGTTGTFSGSGYTTSMADCSGDISASPPLFSSSTCAVDSNGILSGTFTVEASASPGSYTVTISGAEVQQGSISVPFYLTNPTALLSPSSGSTGTTVSVAGLGWSTAEISVSFADSGLFDGTKTCAVSEGAIAPGCSFTVKPNALGGTYGVTFTGTLGDSAQGQFVVQTTFVMTPKNGGSGTTVTLSGSGYIGAIADCVPTIGVVPASPALIDWTGGSCSVDANGLLTGRFKVASTANDGPYMVTLTHANIVQGSVSDTLTVAKVALAPWSLLNGLSPDASALAASSSQLFLAARGMENGIWYRGLDASGAWSGWSRVPGFTDVRPAVEVFNSRLYFVCKEAGTSRIWFGYYPLTGGVVSGSFSGWTLLPGPTPAALSVGTDGSYLYVAAEGMDGSIWHRRMDTSGTWSVWTQIPGFTDVSPAISIFQNRLYFACKQKASNNIWYGYVDLAFYPNGWSGWTLIPGPTPDALTLTVSSDHLYVAARGMDSSIWYRSMDSSGTWNSWSQLPGYTSSPIGISVYSGSLWFAAREAGTNKLWITNRPL